MLFIATAHANSKYSYHFLTFEFLKYIYQNWIEGVGTTTTTGPPTVREE